MKHYNVLVFPGGTEIGLEIQRALCQCKEIRLFSAGSDVSNHAPYVFARHFIVPSIHDPEWIHRLNQVVVENSIDYIFPAYDDVIVALIQNVTNIHAKIVTSPLETCLLTRSKSRTYEYFASILPIPIQYHDIDAIGQYPVFVKPDRGQGSQHTQIVHTKEQLLCALRDNRDLIVLEYLPGDEYTVDCFCDRERGLLFCGSRQRVRTKSGIAMHSRQVYEPIFEEYARTIAQQLSLYGAWFFQLKQDREGIYKLLEIGPRIAGTMALHRGLGVNFALLSLYEQERIPITIMRNDMDLEIDRSLVNRYRHNLTYRTVYVDFDDTVILNGEVNTELIQFLYQCVNNHKRIVLITKHTEDIHETLRRYRLGSLFDEVIHLRQSEQKSDYVDATDAILIDDSFSERKNVQERAGILTFDSSMFEVLIDYKK